MVLPSFLRKRSSSGAMAAVVCVVVFGVFLIGNTSHASITEFFFSCEADQCILNVIGVILQWLVYAVGSLLLLCTNLFITIAQYTGFGDSTAVNVGWAIVRDLTNMFFVLLMLVVAFGTILGREEFSYRQMLPRLLAMAVLINFSKVIAGLFIDFSQVIMLTFVNGFAAVAGANIVSMLKLNTITSLSPTRLQETSGTTTLVTWDNVGGLFLGVVMLGIALAVIIIMMIILAFRIVMLWLLVIMSPLAFFASTFPRGRLAEAYSTWWKEFGNYLTIGPFMAFFLWLSFAVAGTGNISSEFPAPATVSAGEQQRAQQVQQFVTSAAEPQNTISYVIGIALLMGGMMLSQQFSVLGGSMIGGAANWVKDKGTKIAKAPLRGALAAGSFAAKDIDSRIKKATGISLNVPAYFRGAAAGLKARQDDRYKAGQAKIDRFASRGGVFGRAMQLAGDPDKFFRTQGLLGVAKIALPSKLGGVPLRGTEYYSNKAEEQKAARKDAEAKISGVQKDRADFMNLYATNIKADVDELLAKATSASTPAEEKDYLDKASRLKKLKEKAREGEPITSEEFAETRALSSRFEASLTKDKRYETFDPRENAQHQAIAATEKGERYWTELAQRARPTGALPEEYGKHGLNGDFLKSEADQAIREEDKTAFSKIMARLGDDINGFLRAAGKDQTADGLKEYVEESYKKVGMDRQEMLAMMSGVSSTVSTKNPNFSGMVKVAAGGVLNWNDEIEATTAQAQSKLAGDRSKAMREKQLLGHRDAEGKAQISDADIAALARNLQSFTEALENPKGVNGKMAEILVEKQDELIQRLGKLNLNPTDLGDFKIALMKMASNFEKLPIKMSDLVRQVQATK